MVLSHSNSFEIQPVGSDTARHIVWCRCMVLEIKEKFNIYIHTLILIIFSHSLHQNWNKLYSISSCSTSATNPRLLFSPRDESSLQAAAAPGSCSPDTAQLVMFLVWSCTRSGKSVSFCGLFGLVKLIEIPFIKEADMSIKSLALCIIYEMFVA